MKRRIIAYSVLFLAFKSALAPHYKAPEFWENPYWGEPFLANDWLTNFTIKFKSGSTDEGHNCIGMSKNIFNIYGPTKLSTLTKGVPAKVLNKNPNSPINNVWMVPGLSDNFGNINFSGQFRSTSLNFYLTQQLRHGLFVGTWLQIEDNRINHIDFTDSTKVTDLPHTITQQEWVTFTNSLFENLTKYGACAPENKIKKSGLSKGDLFFGWSRNFTGTEYLDFVDFTGIIGISWPGGTDKNTIFNLDHNLGRPTDVIISARAAIGVWDWLTTGVALGTEVRPRYYQVVPMKTDKEQSGMVKLAQGKALVDKKPLIHFNIFAKAEHFHKRFSIIFAYQYSHQKRTILSPDDIVTFKQDVVNCDCTLRGWKMHTINLSFDYEFATDTKPTLPKVGVFFDLPVGGKSIFLTKQCGLGLSIKTEW